MFHTVQKIYVVGEKAKVKKKKKTRTLASASETKCIEATCGLYNVKRGKKIV